MLLLQGARVQPWSGKMPQAVEQLTLCATTKELVLWSPCSATREATAMRSPCTTTRQKPAQQWGCSQIKKKIMIISKPHTRVGGFEWVHLKPLPSESSQSNEGNRTRWPNTYSFVCWVLWLNSLCISNICWMMKEKNWMNVRAGRREV